MGLWSGTEWGGGSSGPRVPVAGREGSAMTDGVGRSRRLDAAAGREDDRAASAFRALVGLRAGRNTDRRLAELEADASVFLPSLRDGDAGVRVEAVNALGASGRSDRGVVDALLAAFDDPHDHVAAAAIRALGSLRVAEAFDQVSGLLDDWVAASLRPGRRPPAACVARAAVEFLVAADRPSPELAGRVLSLLDAPALSVRVRAAWALGVWRHRPAVDAFTARLEVLTASAAPSGPCRGWATSRPNSSARWSRSRNPRVMRTSGPSPHSPATPPARSSAGSPPTPTPRSPALPPRPSPASAGPTRRSPDDPDDSPRVPPIDKIGALS